MSAPGLLCLRECELRRAEVRGVNLFVLSVLASMCRTDVLMPSPHQPDSGLRGSQVGRSERRVLGALPTPSHHGRCTTVLCVSQKCPAVAFPTPIPVCEARLAGLSEHLNKLWFWIIDWFSVSSVFQLLFFHALRGNDN